jgi:hypothetical protein
LLQSSWTPLECRRYLGTGDQRAQGLAIADHDLAAPGIDDPGRTPKGELFIDRLGAGADQASEIRKCFDRSCRRIAGG